MGAELKNLFKIFFPKNFGQKDISPQKNLVPTKCCSKNSLCQKILLPKNVCLKKMFVPKINGHPKIVQRNVGPGKILLKESLSKEFSNINIANPLDPIFLVNIGCMPNFSLLDNFEDLVQKFY